ncbi:hypothetical protein D3C76_1456490 [compost metagenome]
MVERVGYWQEQQVAVAREHGQVLFTLSGQRTLVTDDNGQAAWAQYFSRAAQGQAEAVGLGHGFGVQRLVDLGQTVEQLQQALLAAPRLDFVGVVVAEHQPADAVVVPQCGPAEQGRGLGRQH